MVKESSGFYLLEGRRESFQPPSHKKVLLEKILNTVISILILFDDDIKESIMATNFQKCNFSLSWTLPFQKIPGNMPLNPLEGLKNIFLAAAWLQKFF